MSENPLTTPRSDDWEIGWELRAFNGGLRRRRLEAGLTQKQLGKLFGVSGATIGHIETMRKRPTDRLRDALANHFDCLPQDIWPDWLEPREQRLSAVAYQKVNATEFSALESGVSKKLLALPSPDDSEKELTRREVRAALDAAMKTLGPRRRDVLRMRYGLNDDGKIYTLEECAKALGISRERVRQIEERALLEMQQHGRRKIYNEPAAELLELNRCPACATYVSSFRFCQQCGATCCGHCSQRKVKGQYRLLCKRCLKQAESTESKPPI